MKNVTYILTSPVTKEEYKKYFEFRWEQLRKPLKLARGTEQDEFEAQAFHCMAVTQEKRIVAVGRIHFDKAQSARIRYMATAEPYRNQGIGGAILERLVLYATNGAAKLCWLKARESALPFYFKHGFFEVGTVDSNLPVDHLRMEKTLP